ncbi:hypothetical protein [Ascidiimonas sp. W6]|uniref:hypothetical protein n=1 Tax=Ascidiimonas meishanensis TaxID=3128903 RepID=UPI0030ED8325
MKYLFLIVVLYFFSACNAQDSTIKVLNEKDLELTNIYQEYYKDRLGFGHEKDSLLSQFTKKLETALSDKRFIGFSFDSLTKSKQVSVVSSKDAKLKLFSWDTFNMGTWHIYNSMYQFLNNDKIYTGLLTKNNKSGEIIDFTDSYHFKIYDFDTNTYLVKSYGTHGGGLDFYTFRLLSFRDNKLVDCKACFDGKNYLLFEKNRTEKASPTYDSKSKTIIYPEYTEDEETGVLKPTGNTITLEYKAGMFLKIK